MNILISKLFIVLLLFMPYGSFAGDSHNHHNYYPQYQYVVPDEDCRGEALSRSLAGQQFDFNGNKKQWAIGFGKAEDCFVPSVGIGGKVKINGSRLLINIGIGVEKDDQLGGNISINGKF